MLQSPVTIPTTHRSRRVAPLLLAALLLAVAAAGLAARPAQAKVTVGIGQQTPELFGSHDWQQLHMPNVRYIAPWDALSDPYQRQKLDEWMASATAVGAKVLLGFQHSLASQEAAGVLPTRAQFRQAFLGFRERYPTIREYVPWNESNNPGALTWRRPRRAAAFFNIATRYCKRCKIVAADVLDSPNMRSWVTRFKRHVRTPPKIWGLHNYHDANSFSDESTKRLLGLVKGKIWFTETGGLIRRFGTKRGKPHMFGYGIRHAAKATRYVLNLSMMSKRIRRIYLYHWRAPLPFTTWDSALMDGFLRPRPGYRTLKSWVREARSRGIATKGPRPLGAVFAPPERLPLINGY